MLNELYQLSGALKNAGIKPPDLHQDFKPLPKATSKKPCFKIYINQDGLISGIEMLDNVLVSMLRKWEPSAGHSFPGFNIQPLYRICDEEKKKLLNKWYDGKEPVNIEELKKWCNDANKNWDSRIAKKLDKCLGDIPIQLQKLCSNIPDEFSAWRKVLERVVIKKTGLLDFDVLELFLINGVSNQKELLALLIHEGSSSKRPDKDRGLVSVFLDVPDWTEYPVASEKTIRWLNDQILFGTNITASTHSKAYGDAFGLNGIRCDSKLPDVRLPVLGDVKLRAMNSESRCQLRYNTIDAESFPIGKISRMRCKCALEWLADLSREGETWGQADGREVVFAYPMIIPQYLPKLAACFGARKSNDTEARFVNYAKDVLDCLKGLDPDLKGVELQVFSLRKMDTKRTKVVFHRSYTAQRLAEASDEWRLGCENIPIVQINLRGKKTERITAKPIIPFPLQIAKCLNKVWKIDGKSKGLFSDEVRVLNNSTGIELLLDVSAARQKVPHLLTVALNNCRALLIYLGENIHRGFFLNNNEYYQLMPTILGLLLWKLGIRKEHYMTNSPYLIGRILKVADELHALYCKELRKNKLPPQLLGNALMVAALEAPTQALSQLAMRIVPYLGWAKTNSTDSAGLSRYFLKEFNKIEETIRNETLPNRLNDAERAQLFLGYISSSLQTTSVNNN